MELIRSWDKFRLINNKPFGTKIIYNKPFNIDFCAPFYWTNWKTKPKYISEILEEEEKK